MLLLFKICFYPLRYHRDFELSSLVKWNNCTHNLEDGLPAIALCSFQNLLNFNLFILQGRRIVMLRPLDLPDPKMGKKKIALSKFTWTPSNFANVTFSF
uniref:Uncharacterized protein n=1 Tax=Pyxicephalus adspersus TaxID=30357 RepID=A0AAV3AL01_PYXAD|nr:TPA: hypothetical protein GDO54_011459 [Pyxicephalus adspersus]